MFEQFEAEMRNREIEAVIVFGDTTLGNPDLTYVFGGNVVRGGVFFRRVGEDPFTIVGGPDVETARKIRRIGRVDTYTEHGLEKLVVKYGHENAFTQLLSKILAEEGVKGKVILYGRNDLADGVSIVDRLRKMGFNIAGESSPTLIESLRETKGGEEIEEMRRVARKTSRVVESVLDILRRLKRKRGHLELLGKPATVGVVKSIISQKLLAEHLGEPEGTIFAQGASAVPVHNVGIPGDRLKEGKLIIFDIFPQAETSYWCDMTRSFVIGRADSKVKQIYDAVYEAQTETLDYLREEVTGEEAVSKACDIIERHGYRTVRDVYTGKAKSISSGLTHTLGHGVGLTIGERPHLTFGNNRPLKRGNVVTVEPGVYFPRYGGARIEDTVLITSRGAESLSNAEKELELT
jgi:Xaa-Pro aminopeptidase